MGGSSSTQRNSASKEARNRGPQRRRIPRQMTRSSSTGNLPAATDTHEPRRSAQHVHVPSTQRDDIRTWIAEARSRQRQRNSDTILASSGGLAWTVGLDNGHVGTTSSTATNTLRAEQPTPPRRTRMIRSTSNDDVTSSRTRQQPESSGPMRRNGRQMVRSASNEHLTTPRTTEQRRRTPQARNRGAQQARSRPLRTAQRTSNVSTPRTSHQPGHRRAGRRVVKSNSSENLSTSRIAEQPRTSSPRRRNARPVIRSNSNEHLSASRQQRRSPPIRGRAFQPVRRSPPPSRPIRAARRVVRSSSNENISASSRATHDHRRRNPVGRNIRQVVASTSNENLPTSRHALRSGQRDNTRAWIAEARSRARRGETEASSFASGGVSWTVNVDGQTNATTTNTNEPSYPEAILPDATLHQGEAPPTYQEAVTNTYKSLSNVLAITTQSDEPENQLLPPPSYSDH